MGLPPNALLTVPLYYLCLKELISPIKNGPKESMDSEKGCLLKTAGMLLKGAKPEEEKN